MATYSENCVKQSLESLLSNLSLELDDATYRNYIHANEPELLHYEKLSRSHSDVKAIQKYLIGAKSFLDQPTPYFDIYRSARIAPFIQFLASATEKCIKNVENYKGRLNALLDTTSFDDFESILFELAVAAKYTEYCGGSRVKFIAETKKTGVPDLEVTSSEGKFCVECKKINRQRDVEIEVRNHVRELLYPNIKKQFPNSFLGHVVFHKDPLGIDVQEFGRQFSKAKKNSSTKTDLFTFSFHQLSYRKLDEYLLYPSPNFYWHRYGFRPSREKSGIIVSLNAKHAVPANYKDVPVGKLTSWLDDVSFEGAISWTIDNDDVLAQYRKLSYTRILKGITQLQTKCDNGRLHVWFERNISGGHRQNELIKFISEKIMGNTRDKFDYLIFNETELSVDEKGHFDCLEHAHYFSPNNKPPPSLTTVFVEASNKAPSDLFGIGTM